MCWRLPSSYGRYSTLMCNDMNPITKLEIYAAIGLMLVLAMLGAYFKGRHDGGQIVQLKFDEFVSEVKAAGAKAEADKAIKEKADAEKITAAVAGRDAAINRLRIEQARPRAGFVSSSASGSGDGGKVCYDGKALDAALRKLDTGVSTLV